MQLSHVITCPFSKYFQIFYIFAQIFKYFAHFQHYFALFWKIPPTPLLSKIGLRRHSGLLQKNLLSNKFKCWLVGLNRASVMTLLYYLNCFKAVNWNRKFASPCLSFGFLQNMSFSIITFWNPSSLNCVKYAKILAKKATILSVYGKTRVRENPYSGIFYTVFHKEKANLILRNCDCIPNIVKKNLIYKCQLTDFSPMFHFFTPWKLQKTKSFLTFSGGIKIKPWTQMG